MERLNPLTNAGGFLAYDHIESLLQEAEKHAFCSHEKSLTNCLWEIVKTQNASTTQLSDAISIAAASDFPKLALQLFDFVEEEIGIAISYDFSRAELIKLVRAVELPPTEFKGTGLLGRGQIFWPLYLITAIEVNEARIIVRRRKLFLFPEELSIEWPQVSKLSLSRRKGWKYRQRVTIDELKINTDTFKLAIDVSNNFPDIENPQGLLVSIAKYRNIIRLI